MSVTSEEKDHHPSSTSTLHDHPLTSSSSHTLPRRPWRVHPTSFSTILSHPYEGQGTPSSPYIIDFLPSDESTGFSDQENPQNYSMRHKWSIVLTAAFATLAVSMASSVLSAALREIRIDFPGKKQELYIMVTSAFVCGFILGPILWAPLSELYGRRPLFLYTYIFFTIFNAAVCASPNLEAMIVLRFLAGTFGASALVNSGGVIADVFSAAQRGLGMAIFAAAPFLGPALGPIIGGFLGQAAGWKWVAAFIAFFCALLTVIGGLLIPETYAPVLLRQRAKRMSKVTGKSYISRGDLSASTDKKTVFGKALALPWVLLFKEPIVALMALYLSLIYAILFMCFTAFPIVFTQHRGWSTGISGLAFLGITIGAFISLSWIIFIENPRYSKKLKAEGGWLRPEERLVTAMMGAIMMPVGLFIFAWTAVPVRIHWIAPIIGTIPFGAGMVFVFLSVMNYLVDSYLFFAASVLAGNTICRSAFGVVFPLFTPQMYNTLGINWAASLTAFLCLALAPSPFIFYFYGERIRVSSKFGKMADDVGKMLKAGMSPAEIQKAMRPQPQGETKTEESDVTLTVGEADIAAVETEGEREAKVIERVV